MILIAKSFLRTRMEGLSDLIYTAPDTNSMPPSKPSTGGLSPRLLRLLHHQLGQSYLRGSTRNGTRTNLGRIQRSANRGSEMPNQKKNRSTRYVGVSEHCTGEPYIRSETET